MSFWSTFFTSFSELVNDSLFSQGHGKGYLAGVILDGEKDYYEFLDGIRDHAVLRLLSTENKEIRVLCQHGTPVKGSLCFMPKAPKKDWDIQASCYPVYSSLEHREKIFAPNYTSTVHSQTKMVQGLPCIYIYF